MNEALSRAAPANFTVTLSPAHNQVVTVNCAGQSGSVTSGSVFDLPAGSLTFNPGETSKTISVDIFGDLVESFSVNLSGATNAVIGDGEGSGTINDDDIAKVSMGFGQTLLEGDSGITQAVFSATLTRPAAFTVTVNYSAYSGVGGTFATEGVDFTPVSGTLTFAPGEQLKFFSIPIIGDILAELDENFSVQLSNANPVSIYGSNATGYKLNDDLPLAFLPFIGRD